MQSADAFGSPCVTSSAGSMAQAAIGGENSNSGNKAGDMALASLWIRRLKRRKEPNSLKGEIFVSDDETLHAGNSDPSSSAHPVGSRASQAASAMKTWAKKPLPKVRKLNDERAVLKDALHERISWSELQDYGGERPQNGFNQEQGRIILVASPSTSGFGKQINQSADTKSEMKTPTKLMTVDKIVNSRCTSEAAMISHTCSQAAERKSQFVHAIRMRAVEGGVLASSLGKPPLPPSHNKAGLPPRPACQKASGILARAAGKISALPTNNKVMAIPLQDVAEHLSHIAAVKVCRPANNTSTGSLSKEGHRAKEDGMGCRDPLSKENGMCIEGRRVLPCTSVDKPISVAQKVNPSVEPGNRQLPMSHGEESLKNASFLDTGKQASSTLLKEVKTLSECSVVSSQADETMEASRSASTTASFPWEMFAGAAGPSQSAREEFVEVYNQARNELKNQKFSRSITKVFHTGMENRSERTRYFPDISIDKLEGQASDQQQQQLETPEKLLSKCDHVDRVFQQGGVRVMAPDDRFSQKELFSEKHNCSSFLKGDFDINQGKKSETFQSVHFTCGKDGFSLMQGQCDRTRHGCVELPSVGQKDCSLTLQENSHCRQCFASGAAWTRQEGFEPTHVDKTDALSHASGKRQPGMSESSPSHKTTLMLLSKRQLGTFDRSLGIITGKESLQRITLPRKAEVWLQRWYPPYVPRIKGPQDHNLLKSNRPEQDLAGGSAGNILPVNESDAHAARVKDLKEGLIEKDASYQRIMAGAEPKQLEANSEMVLPSAAAMAIIGTVAKQFCTVQRQHKRSFAFWSGFGMPPPQTPDHFMENGKMPEHFTEKGKRKVTFKADAAHP